MPKREEKRNLETIPVGSLGIIPLKGVIRVTLSSITNEEIVRIVKIISEVLSK